MSLLLLDVLIVAVVIYVVRYWRIPCNHVWGNDDVSHGEYCVFCGKRRERNVK